MILEILEDSNYVNKEVLEDGFLWFGLVLSDLGRFQVSRICSGLSTLMRKEKMRDWGILIFTQASGDI